ncbi:MAG TPA: phage holin family protein [Candidatus Polarisedimenticolaceae bacterium]
MTPNGEEARGAPAGFLESIRTLATTVVALAHDRLELAATELQEEIARLAGVLLWALTALLLAVVGVAFVAIMILLAVDPAYRALAAGLLAILFLAGAGVAAMIVRRILRAKPRAFDASLAELEKDRQGLGGGR